MTLTSLIGGYHLPAPCCHRAEGADVGGKEYRKKPSEDSNLQMTENKSHGNSQSSRLLNGINHLRFGSPAWIRTTNLTRFLVTVSY